MIGMATASPPGPNLEPLKTHNWAVIRGRPMFKQFQSVRAHGVSVGAVVTSAAAACVRARFAVACPTATTLPAAATKNLQPVQVGEG